MVRGTGWQYEGSFKRPRRACVAAPLAVRAHSPRPSGPRCSSFRRTPGSSSASPSCDATPRTLPRAILVQPAVDGGVSMAWVDENGVLGSAFDGPPGLVDALPRAEGGFFLQQTRPVLFPVPTLGRDAGLGRGESRACARLASAPGLLGAGLVSGRAGARRLCHRAREPDAGHPGGPVGAGRAVRTRGAGPRRQPHPGLGHTTLGADGTVFVSGNNCDGPSSLSASLEVNAGARVCTCAWQCWLNLAAQKVARSVTSPLADVPATGRTVASSVPLTA